MKKLAELDRFQRSVVVAAVATVIHRRAGHVEDDEGPVGGCYRTAEEVVNVICSALKELGEG